MPYVGGVSESVWVGTGSKFSDPINLDSYNTRA